MARLGAFAVVLQVALVILLALTTTARGALPSDNISVQWNRLFMQLFCTSSGVRLEPNIMLAHLNLAQWHALIALKQTEGCTTEEAVVAYASYKVMQNYFPLWIDTSIDRLLANQTKALGLTKRQKKLAQSLGEAVAKRLIRARQPTREFVLEDLRDAIAARQDQHTPGLFGFVPNTPHNESAVFGPVYYSLEQPFVIPDPTEFVEKHLSHLKPPRVPSDEWDAAYESLVNVGRIDWPRRTAALNFTASLYSCVKVNVTFTQAGCNNELLGINAAINSLPATTPLYDVVTLLAKMSVAMYETQVVIFTMKTLYYFWRPAMAFCAGDERHDPFPNWTPYAYRFFDPEYPSGTVGEIAAGGAVLQSFFGEETDVEFTIDGNGAFGPTCPGSAGVVIPPRHYDSIPAFVEEAKRGRIWSGAHYNTSTRDGGIVGARVAKYVLKHWAKRTPSGVLPDTEYMDVFAKLPAKAGRQFSPVRYDY